MVRKDFDLSRSAYAEVVEQFIAEPMGQTRAFRGRTVSAAIAQPTQGDWGWLPAVSLVNACGLLLIAFGNTAALSGSRYAEWLFWLGLLVLIVPTALRLISVEAARKERIGLVVVLGLAFYLVKVLHSPFAFTFADELVHLYNVDMILEHQRLFTENFILPATAQYPGLESVTAALSSLSGLAPFYAGLIVIGVARLMLGLGFYLFVEQVSGSMRAAGVATLLYMGQPNFLYWSSQFSYESLSFPLLLWVLFVAARRETDNDNHLGLTLLALLGISAVVITHHLSSYFLAAFLILWTLFYFRLHLLVAGVAVALVRWYGGEVQNHALSPTLRSHITAWLEALRNQVRTRAKYGPQGLALFAVIAALLWLLFIAGLTTQYLSPVLSRAVLSVVHMIAGEESGRQLFVSSSGHVAPLWERVTGIGSVLLCFLGLPFGLYQVWRALRHSPLALLLSGAALAYFGILGLRFVPAGWETGNRASAYLFVGLSFTLSLGFVGFWMQARTSWLGRCVFAGYVAIIFIGGVIAGWPPALRQAQPYWIESSGQTLAPQGITVADWARTVLGPGHSIAGDDANGRLLMVYGEQHALIGKHPDVVTLLQEPTLNKWQRQEIQKWAIQYALVDRRRISWDSMAGYYFDHLEQGAIPNAALFEPEVYEKFDREPKVSRLMDSGNIVIYGIGALGDDASVR